MNLICHADDTSSMAESGMAESGTAEHSLMWYVQHFKQVTTVCIYYQLQLLKCPKPGANLVRCDHQCPLLCLWNEECTPQMRQWREAVKRANSNLGHNYPYLAAGAFAKCTAVCQNTPGAELSVRVFPVHIKCWHYR